MAKFNDKISTILNSQLPEFVVADHPKFAQFLKVYYQLLESAELSIDTIEGTDGILLQSETGQTANLVLNSSRKDTARTLLDAGDKILLEESTYGKFTRGETVTGQTSKATAVVLVEDIANNRLIISAQDKFIDTEVIVGSSSGAQANITNYKPNPVNNIADLVNFRDPDNVINHYLTNMRDEFLATLPEQTAAGVDKRKLIKNIKSMYRAKGSVRGHEMFFRILFGETSETFYPREQMLKASDGQFDSLKVLRVIATVGDATQLTGRKINEYNGTDPFIDKINTSSADYLAKMIPSSSTESVWGGDITYGLNPVVENRSAALYFGKTLIGADGEDDNGNLLSEFMYNDNESVQTANQTDN